jgi:hypothetical protein
MYTFGFVLDNGVNHLKDWLPRNRARTLPDLGLARDSDDLTIVRKAVAESLIIVTANGDDFLRLIDRYRRTSARTKTCHDASGMLIVMDAHVPRRSFAETTTSLRLDGRRIGWGVVTDDNLVVRLAVDDRTTVGRLPRCFYCAQRSA